MSEVSELISMNELRGATAATKKSSGGMSREEFSRKSTGNSTRRSSAVTGRRKPNEQRTEFALSARVSAVSEVSDRVRTVRRHRTENRRCCGQIYRNQWHADA